jgi:hypothetical protein
MSPRSVVTHPDEDQSQRKFRVGCGKVVGTKIMTGEDATAFKTPAADDPALAEAARRPAVAYPPDESAVQR